MRQLLLGLTVLGTALAWADTLKIESAYSYLEPSTVTQEEQPALTFIQVALPEEELLNYLQGRWHVLAHCDGSPLPEAWYVNEQMPGSLKTFILEPEIVGLNVLVNHLTANSKPRNISLGTIALKRDQDGWYALERAKIRPVRIKETGEMAFESKGNYALCKPGIHARPIWVSIPIS